MSTLREAAQQALEALEQSETSVAYEGFGMAYRQAERKHQAAITALRAALAQEQAEPVQESACDKDPRGCYSVRCQLGKVCKNTAPRQRRPLTEEEIRTLALATDDAGGSVIEFARAVERAHGIE